MSDNEQRERIIAKIKKCLALSASPEPAEAAAAMRQAQKLMEKYNIDMATVERPEIFEARVHSKMSVSTPKRWEVALVAGICRAFGCRFYFMPGNSYGLAEDVYGRYCFIGTYEQTVIAEWTTKLLFQRHGKSRREYYKALTDNPYFSAAATRKDISQRLDSFSIGWVVSVIDKVVTMANPKAIDDAIEEKLNKTLGENSKPLKTRKQDEVSRESYYAGHAEGEKESIHRPMGGQPGPKPALLENHK